MSAQEIVDAVSKYPCDIVVITGGEPALQLTSELVDMLHGIGRRVHVETSSHIQQAMFSAVGLNGNASLRSAWSSLAVTISFIAVKSSKDAVKDAILDGTIPNEREAAFNFILPIAASLGLTPQNPLPDLCISLPKE